MANKIYLVRETPVKFNTFSGGAGKAFSIASLANGSGFRSARLDLGAGSKPYRFEWRAYLRLVSAVTTPDGSQSLDLYVATSDATFADGNSSASEGTISSTSKRFNLKAIGSILVDSSSETDFYSSGTFEVSSRYFSLVLFNFSGVALSATNTASVNGVDVTPLVEEIQ